MKRIRILDEDEAYWWEDCKRLVRVFAERSITITIPEAKKLWERYSDGMSAGWMGMPDSDDDLFTMVEIYFDVVEEDEP